MPTAPADPAHQPGIHLPATLSRPTLNAAEYLQNHLAERGWLANFIQALPPQPMILGILSPSSQNQVFTPDTAAVIATLRNPFTLGDRAKLQHPGQPTDPPLRSLDAGLTPPSQVSAMPDLTLPHGPGASGHKPSQLRKIDVVRNVSEHLHFVLLTHLGYRPVC